MALLIKDLLILKNKMKNKEELNNRYIPYGKHNINKDDIRKVIKVLRSNNLTQGESVPLFEKSINLAVNSKYSVAVNSATSALHLACLALGLEDGNYLWTSPTTFVASANCGLYCGAKIDFVDIDPKSGLISILELKKKLVTAEKNGTLPRILIPVHLAGNPCDMREIWNLSKKYGFKIIEDASHAIGAKYEGKPVGNCEFSDITVFSFHPVKIITTAEGGIATTNQESLSKKMRELRSHGITKDSSFYISKSSDPWYYEQQDLGFNYRMSDIHASLGISQIKRLNQIVRERNRLIRRYKNKLAGLPISFLENSKDTYSSVHLAIIRFNNKDCNFHRKIFNYLRNAAIGVQIHYIPVHLHPYFKKLGFKKGDFPEAELYSHNAISLPLYFGLSNRDQDRVIKLLKTFFD